MNGYLQDGQIHSTKYNLVYQWMAIIILSLNILRFTALLFTKKESQLSKQLGEWSYFYGPRFMINGICAICFSYIIFVMFFKYCNQDLEKMFYWLKIMEYHSENRCFVNMNLNEQDSKMFVKRISFFIFSIKSLVYLFIFVFVFGNFFSVYKYVNDYYLNYFISTIAFIHPNYYGVGFIVGLPVILYFVSLIFVLIIHYKFD